jgi:hypothetical protein
LMLGENLAPLGAQATLEQLHFVIVIGLYVTWSCCLSSAGNQVEAWPDISSETQSAIFERDRATRALYAGAVK